MTSDEVTAGTLRRWLHDGDELALLDVREPGQIADGHILFSAPLPYSRLELDLPRLAPNRAVRMVLCDGGDGVARRAAERARALGYVRVHWLEGGVGAWARAGHTLYQGVNVPSKAFGELVEHACATPRLDPGEVAAMQARGADMVIVDGRTGAEFTRMNIPGARWCPNGELALRIDRLAPDPGTTVVVNCAGRTRSIIGAQTLIELGLANPVFALENGTQGWTLSGLALGHGADAALPEPGDDLAEARRRARSLAERHGAAAISAATLAGWIGAGDRTVYLLDVRTAEERAADPDAARALLARHAVAHAPGGQLAQATDQWIGARRARLVLLDGEGVRAPVVAAWLCRQGHEAVTLNGGIEALGTVPERPVIAARLPELPPIAAPALAGRIGRGATAVLDLRASAAYRAGHVPGAVWTVRPRLTALAGPGAHVLVADEPAVAALAARDLAELGCPEVLLLDGGFPAWGAAGLPVEATPDAPADAERIDFIAFTHGRHEGDLAASRQYLAWETGLVAQLDADERAVFRV